MTKKSQEELMDAYLARAKEYGAPRERPTTNDQTAQRRWYRDEVQRAFAFSEILEIVEQMIEISDDPGVREPFGRSAMSKLAIQHELEKMKLNGTAVELGLTPPEWD